MGVTFNDATKKLLDGNNFPVLATINADGSAQTSVLWAKRDGDTVIFATVRGRLKERNMARDPRVSVSVFDQDNPYDYVEIRGTVEMTDEGGRELINDLSHEYLGKDYPAEPADVVRVLVRITPTRITGNAA